MHILQQEKKNDQSLSDLDASLQKLDDLLSKIRDAGLKKKVLSSSLGLAYFLDGKQLFIC